jgi:putative peptidoglycan lipid II flippase
MTKDSPSSLSKSASHFLSGTLLSRLTGAGRDLSLAFCFGSSPAIAAFMIAFRFSHLLRRFFGEGPLPAGFIPHFEQLRLTAPEKGAQFFRDLFYSLTIVLIALVAASELFLWGLLTWGSLSADAMHIVSLTMLMLPGAIFICLYGLNSALLQCEGSYFLPAVSPVAFNLIWIAATWLLIGLPHSDAVIYLSLAIVLAFFMQWLATSFKALGLLTRLSATKFKARLFSADVKNVMRAFFLGVIGVGAVQINSALDSLFAHFASVEGPAYLWYAIRLEQLPLALFGVALSAALLPPLSRAATAGDIQKTHLLLQTGLKRSFSLIFPSTIAIFVLGAASVNLIYGRGDFSAHATYETILCLWGYAIGLLPSVFVMLFAPAFYAQKNYRTTTWIAVACVALNVALNALFVFVMQWGAFSIALATSISAWFNCLLLGRLLSKKVPALLDFALFRSFFKTALCSLIAGAAALLIGHFLTSDPTLLILRGVLFDAFPRSFLEQFMHFLVLTGAFAVFFFSYAWMMRADEVLQIIGISGGAEK